MWKPWILAVVGSIVMLNAAGNSNSYQYQVADAESSEVMQSKFGGLFNTTTCTQEMKNACAAESKFGGLFKIRTSCTEEMKRACGI
jgi:hypothetical protein